MSTTKLSYTLDFITDLKEKATLSKELAFHVTGGMCGKQITPTSFLLSVDQSCKNTFDFFLSLFTQDSYDENSTINDDFLRHLHVKVQKFNSANESIEEYCDIEAFIREELHF